MLHHRSSVDEDERVQVELEDEVLHRSGGVDGDERVSVELEGEVVQSLIVVDEDERGGVRDEVDEWTHSLGKSRTVLHELVHRPAWLRWRYKPHV